MRTPTSAPLARTIGLTRSAGGHAVRGIDGDRRAARVVLVETAAGIDEKLRVGPGPEHEREFGAGDAVAGGTAVRIEIAVDVELGAVEAQARDHAQPVGGLHLLLGVEAEPRRCTASSRMVERRTRSVGEIEADLADVVEAGFDAEAQLARQAADAIVTADLGVQAISLAVVELLELIAVRGVDGVGEVGEQVELVVERVGSRLEAPVAERLRDFEVECVAAATRHRRSDRRSRSGLTTLNPRRAPESGRWNPSCRRRPTPSARSRHRHRPANTSASAFTRRRSSGRSHGPSVTP